MGFKSAFKGLIKRRFFTVSKFFIHIVFNFQGVILVVIKIVVALPVT
jgi:hypothetical protein